MKRRRLFWMGFWVSVGTESEAAMCFGENREESGVRSQPMSGIQSESEVIAQEGLEALMEEKE